MALECSEINSSIRQMTYFSLRLLPARKCGSLKTKFIPRRLVIAAALITTLVSGCAIGFSATTTGTRVSVPLMFGKAQVLAIEWR